MLFFWLNKILLLFSPYYNSYTPIMKRTTFIILIAVISMQASAQNINRYKLSAMLRQICLERRCELSLQQKAPENDTRKVCSFIKIHGTDGTQLLNEYGCRPLAKYGDVYIAEIPLKSIAPLSVNRNVERIEAGHRCSALMDSVPINVDALPAYACTELSQAFTGKGVVMGIEDIGFDLTHPNFYNSSLTEYRIKRYWDQLSTDTIGSLMPVGAEYTTEDAIKQYAHSRDGLIQSHGTHTLGIAAGSGYNTNYRGIAYESDICLVSNAASEDALLIDSADWNKYTSATDALGFKYILDYATAQGKPGVVSFSEGESQDLYGDNKLLYEVLDSMTGAGRIIVASAGNDGHLCTYVDKPKVKPSAGTYILSYNNKVYLQSRGDDKYALRLVFHDDVYGSDTLMINTDDVIAAPDSLVRDTLIVGRHPYFIAAGAYPSCYNAKDLVMELLVSSSMPVGVDKKVSVEAVGTDAHVEMFLLSGNFVNEGSLCDGQSAYSIHSPSSAPSVICVGATTYRKGFVDYRGDYHEENELIEGPGNGYRACYSSIGPTLDGRIKPDVLAPGTNVISSYSSYYMENCPDASDLKSNVAVFDFNGRKYAWNSNMGTSMSSPVVGGAIALWLQARPTLTPKDILSVLSRTCIRRDHKLTYPNNFYGYGEIDVYKGLLDVLDLVQNVDISSYQSALTKVLVMDGGKQLRIHFNETADAPFEIRIYSVNGSMIKKLSFKPGLQDYDIDAAGMQKGIYAVQISSKNARATGSSLIRL
jgi:subtilisin family serine protease